MRRRWLIAGAAATAVLACGATAAGADGLAFNPFGDSKVGTQADGRILLPDNQWIAPYGQRTVVGGMSVGTAISPDGTKAATQTDSDVEIIDAATGAALQSFGDAGIAPPVYSPDGTALYVATSTASGGDGEGANAILKYAVGPDGLIANPSAPQTLILPSTKDFAYGLTLSADGATLYAALSASNRLGVIDTATLQVTAAVPVGNAPQAVAVVGNEAFVSNRGGRVAAAGDTTNDSDGTAIVSDPSTGAAATGTVSVVDLATDAVSDTIDVGLQPTSLTVNDGSVFVTNANSDTVSVIDAASHQVTQTINVDPLPGTTVGASPTSVVFPDPNHLLVSVGRDNALAVFGYNGGRAPMQYQGLIPTDEFPTQLSYDAKLGTVIVNNKEGISTDGADKSHAIKGSLTSFAMPAANTLADLTRQVFANNGWDHLNAVNGAAASSGQRPSEPLPAVPTQLGQPSAINHVFLVIKENRTYDQVLGDIGKGDSDPTINPAEDSKKGLFGEQVTPNLHSLANTFTLFDNFYDEGKQSPDGHNWLLQGDANDYLEQQVSTSWGRSYPYPGGDPLAYQRDGFLWNTVQAAGKSVRNYGEFESLTSGKAGTWQQYYADSQILEGKATGPLPVPIEQFQSFSDVPSLRQISNPNYPKFNTKIPDQYRVDIWEQDFKQAEQSGNLPNLTILQLPDDHTGGTPTADAQVADNDLAVGRIVSDVSHSQFWKDSAVFVLEDDTQAGVDHVDGHRGPLWIASPYAQRGAINSSYYSQVNVVRTIEQILGAQPMNQMDRAAVPMLDAFTSTPDPTPYDVVPNKTPLTLGVKNLIPLTPSAATAADPTAAADLAATDGPAPPPVPTAQQSTADAWSSWYESETEPKLGGANAAPDAVNPAQLNRYDWYCATNWSQPYPGDTAILTPDLVPGRNLPSNLLGD